MTVPKRRSSGPWGGRGGAGGHRAGIAAAISGSGKAGMVFFLALFVAAALFLNNLTQLGNAAPAQYVDFLGRTVDMQHLAAQNAAAAQAAAAAFAARENNPQANHVAPPEVLAVPPAASEKLPSVSAIEDPVGGGDTDDNLEEKAKPPPIERPPSGESPSPEDKDADEPNDADADDDDADPAGLDTDEKKEEDGKEAKGGGGDDEKGSDAGGNGGGGDNDKEDKVVAPVAAKGSAAESEFSKLTPTQRYQKFKADIGILNETPFDDYKAKHAEIDERVDPSQRCRRYGYSYTAANNRNRRIFYGAPMLDEPWELFEMLAAESYGLLHAMVLIEPDVDVQSPSGKLPKREPLRLEATELIKFMFGVENVKILSYTPPKDVHDAPTVIDLMREEIVKAWIELGMEAEDVAYMSNLDDMFARDYVNAIRNCELPEMKYELHHCLHNRVKTFGNCQVYETSPECVSRTKKYEHPDMMIGACMVGIGDEAQHQIAPRDSTHQTRRAEGWTCDDRSAEKEIKDQTYPLWTGTDLRELCGGRQANLRAAGHQQYSAFHFRNWFRSATDMRALALQDANAGGALDESKLYAASMDDMETFKEDLRVTYRCLAEIDDEPKAVTKREPGGFAVLKPMTPLYLQNEEYRKKTHQRAQTKVLEDEKKVKGGGSGGAKKEEATKEKAKTDTTKTVKKE